jgi:intracellular septation protein
MNTKALLHLTNEFAPIVAFFFAAQLYSFFTATAVLIASTIIALSVGWYFEKRFPMIPIISAFFVIISGAITLVYRAPDALIFADSLYYLLMGLTTLGGLFLGKNLLKLIFETTFAMSDTGWKILAHRWIIIFLAAGIINEIARFYLSPEEWVNFKVLKVITIAIFGFYQFTISRKYRLPELSNAWGLRNDKVLAKVVIPN